MADGDRREVTARWRELPAATRRDVIKLARKRKPHPDAAVREVAAAYATAQVTRPVWLFLLAIIGAVAAVILFLRLIYDSWERAMPAIIGAVVGGVIGGWVSLSRYREVRDVNSAVHAPADSVQTPPP